MIYLFLQELHILCAYSTYCFTIALNNHLEIAGSKQWKVFLIISMIWVASLILCWICSWNLSLSSIFTPRLFSSEVFSIVWFCYAPTIHFRDISSSKNLYLLFLPVCVLERIAFMWWHKRLQKAVNDPQLFPCPSIRGMMGRGDGATYGSPGSWNHVNQGLQQQQWSTATVSKY